MLSFLDFCTAFEEHVARTRPKSKLEKEALGRFAFTNESGTRMSLSLANAYQFYEAAPHEIESLFQRMLVMMEPVSKVAPQQLIGMVRDKSAFQSGTAIVRDLAPDLVMVIAADLGDRFIFPSAETFAASGIEHSEAVAHAMHNVDRFVGDVTAHQHSTGFRMFGSSNDIGSSLILSDRFLRSIRAQSEGEPVFIVVARNFLVVGDSANVESVRSMCRLATSTDPGPHPISSEPIIYKDGAWVRFHAH
jgi:uncharacterized protein YtpQ (UPF0354 family)